MISRHYLADQENLSYTSTSRGKLRLKNFDPRFVGKQDKKQAALVEIEKLQHRMSELQFRLFAEKRQSILICLQAPDAGGKDGVVRHVLGSMNPQSCRAISFKEPSPEELAHDFLWRIEQQAPKLGEIVVFNRSHYEDVLVVRVHNLVPKAVWSRRYEQINEFEQRLVKNGTHILKFFLNISKEEQLRRFKKRLEDPERRWKISEADYSERELWEKYQRAYLDVLTKCHGADAPWYVIPSNHKWFRDLLIAQIIVEKMEKLQIKIPRPNVDLEKIKKKYHQAVRHAK